MKFYLGEKAACALPGVPGIVTITGLPRVYFKGCSYRIEYTDNSGQIQERTAPARTLYKRYALNPESMYAEETDPTYLYWKAHSEQDPDEQ